MLKNAPTGLNKQSSGSFNFNNWNDFTISLQEWIASSHGDFLRGKHFIGFVTVVFTVAVMPLFRFISQGNSSFRSKSADAGFWVLSNIFGIGIIIYPWWLATAKSPLYYSRLQYCGKIISALILILAGLQGIFTPEQPFDKNDPSKTSMAYKVLSSLNFAAIFLGLLVVLPVFIRRDRLFQSNSQALFRFAWLFTAIMLVGLLIRRWTGFSRIVSFSCLFLVIQFFVLNYVEDVERRRIGKVGIFDEAYIIIAGFVPYWLAFAVGATLLEIVSQAGAVGTVFVYFAWRMVIYALEYMASEVGRKASRFSDGSVFAYSAIYTGATFANFIFLSVQFNSPTFWALLLVTVANIIIVQGGVMVDIDYLFMDYVATIHNWPSLDALKVWYFEFFRNMPHEMALKVASCADKPTPEIQLALIRGRATVLQLNWVHNDIKMSSEFQALACACVAVAAEIGYGYLGVGADSITANLSDRRGVLYIYCVNILFSFFAQSIARRRLRHKVSKLKKEISATVKALETAATGAASAGRPVSMASRRSSTASNGSATSAGRPNAGRRGFSMPMRRGSTTMFSAITNRFSGVPGSPGADVETGRADGDAGDDENDGAEAEETRQLIPEQEVDTDALSAILGLCKLYATEDMLAMEQRERTEAETKTLMKRSNSALEVGSGSSIAQSRPFAVGRAASEGILPSSTRAAAGDEAAASPPAKKTRFGNIRFVRNARQKSVVGLFGGSSDVPDGNDTEEEDDGWDEVQLTTRLSSHFRASLSKPNTIAQRMSTMFGGAPQSPVNRRGSAGTPRITNMVRMQGYLNKRKPGTTSEYQRRFFVLTDRQLMYFEKEEDVEMHINRRKGAINVASITNVDRYDPTSLCIINVAVHGRVYIMMAADRACADEWYDMIQEVREASKAARAAKQKEATASGAAPVEDEEDPETGRFSLPWFGGGGEDERTGARAVGANLRQSIAFGLGGLTSALRLDGDSQKESPAIGLSGGGVTEMIRRGTTNARRGLGSIYFGTASGPSVPAASTAVDEVWKHGWDVSALPRKMGYMQKKGEVNSAWQQRWFVLDTAGNISWYDKAGSERQHKPKGFISIGEIVCVNAADPEQPRLVEFRHVQGRVYQLEAGSDLDAEDWRRVITIWVESAHAAIDKYNKEHKDPFIVGTSNSSATYDQEQEEADEVTLASGETKTADADSPAVADVPRKKSGFLLKRGGANPNFKRRWLVLDHPGVLTWYEKENHELKPNKAKGSLSMAEVMCVKVPRSDAPNLIEIKHIQGRTYEMEAPTSLEADEWRAELNRWLKAAHQAVKVTKAARRHSASAPEDPSTQARSNAEDDSGNDTQGPVLMTPPQSLEPVEGGSEKGAHAEAIKKRYFMFSVPGLTEPRRSKEKYQLLSTGKEGVDPNAAPAAPDSAAEDEVPEATATELIEALTKTRDHRAAQRAGSPTPTASAKETRRVGFAPEGSPTIKMAKTPTRQVFWDMGAGGAESGERASEEEQEPTLSYEMYKSGDEEDGCVAQTVSPFGGGSKVPFGRADASAAGDGGEAKKPRVPFGGALRDLTLLPPPPPRLAQDIEQEDLTAVDTTPEKNKEDIHENGEHSSPGEDVGSRTVPFVSATEIDSRESPSFSKLSASITGHAQTRPESPELPRPVPVRTPGNRVPRATMRRQSSVERALDDRRRGFTASTPQPVSQMRKQAKRNNILNTQVAAAKIEVDKDAIRRESDLADSKFMHRMGKRHSSELVDNMQKKSYKDMNAEFWVTHKWYLAAVVCFVTLNVLYTTSYIVSTYK